MREKVRSRQYIMSLHAMEEMEDDELSIFDIESCVLTGQIIERQKDAASAEWKYIVRGQALSGELIITVGKLSITGKLVLITVYRD
jgi:hypothetical protein